MNTTLLSARRALVLGGGGSSGNAWEIGVLAGLAGAGLDVTRADLIIGTSAGATAAAQISAVSPAELYAATVAAAPAGRPGGRPASSLETSAAIIAAASDAADMRRRMGAAALAAEAAGGPDAQARRRAVVAARLPSPEWPERPLVITVVDARTGDPVALDRDSGVDLVDAVAASTAGPGAPAHRVGDHLYIDGGFRSNENADLAAGYGRVLVLSPFGGRTRQPLQWGFHLAAQADVLRAGGSRVETVFPDEHSVAAFGDDMMDLSRRPLVARAGYDQGQALAGPLAEFWRA